jgi:very-short-patch-repair endonuclease
LKDTIDTIVTIVTVTPYARHAGLSTRGNAAGYNTSMLFSGRPRAEPELSKSALKYTAPFTVSAFDSPIEESFWFTYRELKPRELRGLVPQYKVGRYYIDFALPRRKIGIELDGWASHSSTTSIAHDRFRQRRLEEAGWHIIRFGGQEVYDNPRACVLEAARFAGRRHR